MFAPPRHRIELVASADGVDWYDDSKATTPHASATAVRGFDRVVLLAGGRNKGLDLAPLGEVARHLRAVVALGEAADEVAKVYAAAAPDLPVTTAASMAEAVEAAVTAQGMQLTLHGLGPANGAHGQKLELAWR